MYFVSESVIVELFFAVADSCEAIASKQSRRSSGSYKLEIKSSEFEVF